MKKILVIVSIILLVTFTVACGANNANEDVATNDVDMGAPSFNYSKSSPGDDGEFGGMDVTEEMAMEPTMTMADEVTPQMSNRKIIKSANMEIETLEYDMAVQKLNDKIMAIGGYIESSNVRGISIEGRYERRSAYYTIRVPEKAFQQFMVDMNTIGNIISENTYGEDITSSYFDTEARVTTLEVQEERLLEILRKAEKIEDIIQLERELSNVRYEIESLTGTIRRWDNLVSYATLQVSIYEVLEITEKIEPPKTLGEEIKQAFDDSIESIKEFVEHTLIAGVGSTPYLIFIIPGAAIGIVIFRKVRKGRQSFVRVEPTPTESKQDES